MSANFESNVFQFEINVKWSNIIINSMNNRLLHQTHSPAFKESIRDTVYHSSSSSKAVPAFITQKPLDTHQSQIKQTHNELNSYIDDLDLKIQKIVQYNQAQLLFAYKNHLQRVRTELTDFKEEAMTVLQAEASHKQKIGIMQKQLVIFREEALKIFQKSLEKDKIIQNLQLELQQNKSQNAHMKQAIKSILKRNKELQAFRNMMNVEQAKRQKIINQDYLGRIQVNSFTSLGVSSNKKFFNHRKSKERVMTTSVNNSKTLAQSNFRTTEPNQYKYNQQSKPINNLDNFTRKLKLKLAYIQPKLLQNIIDSASEAFNTVDSKVLNPFQRYPNDTQLVRRTGNSIRSKSHHTCQSKSLIKKPVVTQHSRTKSINDMACDSELKDCFKMSVEAIKKEIVRRRKMKTINFFKEGSPVSLEDFKKIDFINLIQLVFSNEKIIQIIYNSIFSKDH